MGKGGAEGPGYQGKWMVVVEKEIEGPVNKQGGMVIEEIGTERSDYK